MSDRGPNSLLSERLALVALASGSATLASALTTTYVVPVIGRKLFCCAFLLDMPNETVDVSMKKATDSSGTSPEAITGKAATQLAADASANDNKLIVINFDQNESDDAKPYVALSCITSANAGSEVVLAIFAGDLSHSDTTDLNISALVEIIG